MEDIGVDECQVDTQRKWYKKSLHRLFLFLYKHINISRKKKGIEDDTPDEEKEKYRSLSKTIGKTGNIDERIVSYSLLIKVERELAIRKRKRSWRKGILWDNFLESRYILISIEHPESIVISIDRYLSAFECGSDITFEGTQRLSGLDTPL